MTNKKEPADPFVMLQSAAISPQAMALPEKDAITEIQIAIDAGWDINTLDQYGGTALIDACDRRLGEVALFLLEAGTDVTVHGKTFNRTALHYAAGGGLFHVVKELVEKGLDVNEKGTKGFTPLLMACEKQGKNRLFNPKQIDAEGKEIKDSGWVKKVEQNYQYYIDTVEFLLENGADVNASSDEMGHTGLHYAAESRGTEIAKILFEHGAKPNVKAKDAGIIPLHFACRLKDLETIGVLVDNGEDVNFQDDYGFTPLHEAVLSNNPNVVKYLLEKGADSTIAVTKGYKPYTNKENAIDIAKDKGFKKILKLLEK